jgi:hypothetical protein
MAAEPAHSPVPSAKRRLSTAVSQSSEELDRDRQGATHPPLAAAASLPEDLYAHGQLDDNEKGPNPLMSKPRTTRKGNVFVIVLVAVIIIAGIIVGAVLGVKARRDGGDLGDPANDTSRVLLPGSKLAVTGRRMPGDGFNVRLFYQGGDGKLRMSAYESTESTWTRPTAFDNVQALKGTPLAASMDLSYPHFQLYYLNESSTLNGVYLSEDDDEARSDSINQQPYQVNANTTLTAYWPYIVTQDEDSSFRLFEWSGNSYINQSLGVNGTFSSPMDITPAVRNYRDPYPTALFYRNADGFLDQHLFGGNNFSDSALSVANIGNQSVTIPRNSAISVMAVARKSSNLTDTYIIYQDDDHQFYVASQVGNGVFNHKLLGVADPGSDFACLTEQTGPTQQSANDPSPEFVDLKIATDMCRCYYQKNGWLREIRLKDSGWEEGPPIPMA